ncbi:initiation factor 2 [Trichocladium antarcticum]|uniref:Translation initiation factor IF-2, mitochondrial n=1 Tax=Trichocladium antarcticum TaxID=1450529 RepID=A0AAN6ZB97_9PEZI|nr:initiation factor 2 [Trichocladium antarcticum]
MMRRGLWQQKNKRPSACVLCRCSYSSGRPTRPTLRAAPSAGSAVASPHRRLVSGLPSWATQQVAPTGEDDLLPQERAARARAAAERAAIEQAARDKAEKERAARELVEREKAAKIQARRDEAARKQAERQKAEAAKRHAARREAVRQQEAREDAARLEVARRQAELERAARAATAQARSPTQPAPPGPGGHTQPARDASATMRPAGGTSALGRILSPSWVSAPSWSSQPAPGASSAPSTSPQSDPFSGLLPHERAAREKRAAAARSAEGPIQRYTLLKADDLGLPSIPGIGQMPAGEREWGNLTRRRRVNNQGLDLSRPFDTQLPVFGSKQPGPRASGSGTAEDQWKRLEQSVAEGVNKGKKDAAKSPNTWGWADEYSDEARKLKVQKMAREIEEEAAAAPQKAGPGPEARPFRRDDRYRRDADNERAKPKKARPRRMQHDEDDGFDEDIIDQRRRRRAEKAEKERLKLAALEAAGPIPIFLPEYISVSNLAIALGQKIDIFLSQLEELGFEDVGKENILTGETAALVAQEYGFEPTVDTGEEEDLKARPAAADPSSLPLRPPVVTIMGHVDHGKTTLLDYLRKSSTVAQEHGGITQHIGAFSVSLSGGKQITFLDTPGHAAFLSMRQRGANVTDMVILVVAADDSVMPQTLEALKHARAAKVPIIVAINKVDRPEANVDRVKSDLATNGVEIEDYGGDVQVVCVSGKTGQGMADLEENILLLAEMLDIRAETDGMAEGWVLESTIKPLGRVATVLIKRGTLRPGDFIVAGRVHAKVRSLRNEAGVEIDEAPPGTAVEVLGWKEPPDAGDLVVQAPDESKAKAAVHYRQELHDRGEIISQMAQQEQDRQKRDHERELERIANPPRRRGRHQPAPAPPPPAEDPVAAEDAPPQMTHLNFTIKGDVHGSVEAVAAAILEQGNNEIRPRVLHAAPGQITEWDVEHAAVAGSTIVNFNNTIPGHIKRLAQEQGVPILEHNVIYHLVEEVRERLADALPPLVIKKVVGEADVLQVFPINLRGRVFKNIAGCRIGNGKVNRNAKARVIRAGETVFEGIIETLKHVKKDVNEMKKGQECGIGLKDWDELQEGDLIQVIEEIIEKRKL